MEQGKQRKYPTHFRPNKGRVLQSKYQNQEVQSSERLAVKDQDSQSLPFNHPIRKRQRLENAVKRVQVEREKYVKLMNFARSEEEKLLAQLSEIKVLEVKNRKPSLEEFKFATEQIQAPIRTLLKDIPEGTNEISFELAAWDLVYSKEGKNIMLKVSETQDPLTQIHLHSICNAPFQVKFAHISWTKLQELLQSLDCMSENLGLDKMKLST